MVTSHPIHNESNAPPEVLARAEAIRGQILALTPAVQGAALALLERICWHRRQAIGTRAACIELCPAYLTAGDRHTHASSSRGWRALRAIVGWFEVSREVVVEAGVKLRKLHHGQRWGRMLVLDDDSVAAAREAASSLGVERRGGILSEPVAIAIGSRVRCPWHDDHSPSLAVRPDGTVQCWACGARGEWAGDRNRTARRWLTAPARPALQRDDHTSSGDRDHVSSAAVGEHVRWRVKGSHGTSCGGGVRDLIQLLRSADRYVGHSTKRLPATTGIGDAVIPDRLVTLSRCVPSAWRRVADRWWVPSAWRPVASRWVVVDWDDSTDAPIDVLGTTDAWGPQLGSEVVAALTTLSGEVTGRTAGVRTGPSGLQVAVELKAGVDASTAWERVARALAPVLEAVFVGGHVDAAARGGRRTMRLPGLRRTKDRDGGRLWMARLAWAS